MKNNSKAHLTGRAVLSLVTRSMHWFSWGIKYAVILPLATMALMALFIFWKDNTTPGQLLAEEIEFVRAIAPAGQFPVHDCPTDAPLSQRCSVIFTDAAGYIEDTNHSLVNLFQMFWCTLALMYMAMALVTRKYPTSPGKMKLIQMKLIRLTADDTRLKEIYSTNNTDTSEKE